MELEKRVYRLISELESIKYYVGLIIPRCIKRILDKKLKSILLRNSDDRFHTNNNKGGMRK